MKEKDGDRERKKKKRKNSASRIPKKRRSGTFAPENILLNLTDELGSFVC